MVVLSRAVRYGSACALLLSSLAACDQAVVTAPVAVEGLPALRPGSMLKTGVAFPCTGSVRAGTRSQPWRYGRGLVRFAPEEVDENGRTVRYHFRGFENGARLVSTAECIIPRTDAAIRRMNGYFGVNPPPQVKSTRIAGPRMTTELDGLYVSACTWGGIWPNCYSKPVSQAQMQCGAMDPSCGGWGGADDPWSWDGGGGTEPYPDEGCDPAVHPDCEQPLTTSDTAAITSALRQKLRPASQFTDSLAHKDCEMMAQWFRDALAAGNVFRGKFDSDSTNDVNGEHYGEFDAATSHIHFDPKGLDSAVAGNAGAQLELAITALHEGSHWGGQGHPNGPTFDSQGRDYYTDTPFNRLNPGPNSCIPR